MTTQLLSFKKSLRLIVPALLLALAVPAGISADIFGPPSTVDYQGRLLDSTGTPFADTAPTNYELRFRLYDAQTGGTVVWAEKQIVTVSKGQFSVRLGEGNPILGAGAVEEGTVGHASPGLPGAFNGKERFLGVTVVLPGQANPAEISPRLSFLASPFSYVAGTAQVAQSVNQPAGTPPSNLNVGSVSYANLPMTATGTINASAHTVLVDSTAAAVAATLPAGTAALNRQLLITKKDTTTNQITVLPPVGGSINGETNKTIYLKVRGESITIQNVGGNDWWIVSESRDKTPVGTIISYASNSVPAGYIAADGANPNKSQYPELVAALGTAGGVPTDNTKFRVPDLRGAFLRGKDGGRGYDEDRGGRAADFAGAATGDNVGSYEGDQFRSHNHGVNDPGHGHGHNAGAGQGGYGIIRQSISGENRTVASTDSGGSGSEPDLNATVGGLSISGSATGISIQSNGGNETRPENYNVNYCIKY